ncbi:MULTISPECIES: hypothetical protein [Bacillus]|uniref:hypothetical protein n=1 Tax=Bacillus TaxID=1386 RepID=UPI0016434821|nr:MULTISPECIES: hypothetical protein [Bacillus amyloliquefaciens group]MBW8584782.1 hypothetical protein [Bacillus amyloliquefaciens]MBY0194314.1 hypothetical protein [Bacillus velezensis]MCG0044015.1 hypothetical protein [Bacillus velezensis]
MKKKLAEVTVTILLVSVITNSFLNGGKPELYTAGVSIRNSVRPSLRKKRKHVKSRMLKTPALFARDLPNCG